MTDTDLRLELRRAVRRDALALLNITAALVAVIGAALYATGWWS